MLTAERVRVAENLVRYVAPPPGMVDRSYDGELGQLVDGLRGPDHFLGSPGTDGAGEYDAVAWGALACAHAMALSVLVCLQSGAGWAGGPWRAGRWS